MADFIFDTASLDSIEVVADIVGTLEGAGRSGSADEHLKLKRRCIHLSDRCS